MHRFFVNPKSINQDAVVFEPLICAQITRVLRLQSGDTVIVLDGNGQEYLVQLDVISKEEVHGEIVEKQENHNEPVIKMTLCISLTQREKFELILQKAVEVGVTTIQPFVSRYSLTREKAISEKRRTRWENILREAAEQSGRLFVPKLAKVLPLPKAIDACCEANEVCLAAWEGENSESLSESLGNYQQEKPETLAVFIGPEGGFNQQEIDLFKENGIRSVSLGKRILRMETAAIVTPALILYALGEMDL